MYISNIQIENFRLLESFSLELNPGLNVIVGENNSGKTALIDAIRIALDTNSAEWTRISEKDFHADARNFKIQLKFKNITPDQAHVFVEHLTHEENGSGGRISVLYVNLVAQLTDNLNRGNRFIRTELRSGESAEGPAIDRDIRQYLSATYLKPLRDAEVELSAGRSSRLAQVLSSTKEMANDGNIEDLLETFIQASLDAQDNPGISASRDSIEEHFQNLTFESDKSKFQLAVQILGSKKFEDMSEPEKLKAFQSILERLSLTLEESKPLQGLGYNNILFMATELIPLEQEEGQFPLLLIEEPEAHIHPQLQMKFLKFIREEYSDEENPKIQTILTTHSPNLSSKAPLTSLIVMKDGAAYPMRKGETKLEDDDYFFLEKFLDVTKANLFFAKAVLIVEGDAENILFPTIAELLGYPLENYGVSIVNVGSTAYARYAKIFMRNNSDLGLLSIPVACVRDLDLWPEKADKDDFPDIGFKGFKPGNKIYWEPRSKDGGEIFGTDPTVKKASLKSFESQNVKVCVSDKWTFEYCLAHSDLAHLVYEALTGGQEGFDKLSADREERAIQIYGMVESTAGAKTDIAYKLVLILKREFEAPEKKHDLRSKLPAYILDALDHVTAPLAEQVIAGGIAND